MKAQLVSENIVDFKRGTNPKSAMGLGTLDDKNLPTKEFLDNLSIKELVMYVANKELVTSEGYGGENEYDFVPEYVNKRIHKELEGIKSGTYDTWDKYTFYVYPENVNIPSGEGLEGVYYIRVSKSRGSAFRVFPIIYNKKQKTVDDYEVDWQETRKLK